MDGIKIQVTGNIAKVIEKPKRLIAGTIGLPVEFFFDETWDDIVKTAVFVAGENVSRLDEIDGKTTVPWEVLQKPGPWLSIGIYGESIDGEKTITTTWANVSPILFGTSLSGDPTDPSAAPIWQKLKDEMENVRDLVEEGYISNASINKDGELELTFMDGSVVNVGRIVNIVDNLGSSDPNAALSARMGGVLKTKIEDDVSALNEQLQPQINQRVKTVNGVAPDENGNVVVEVPEGSGGSGEPGADGFSPVATVTQTGSGAVISVTDKSGTTTATVFNGKDGKDGYTPVKGVDYFDGAPGKDGVDGKDGAKGDKGDPGEKGDTGAPGADGAKGDKGDKGDTGAQGNPGKDGADGKDGSNGKDGVSATHSWNGTTLTITSASGTSSANLKGEKGDKGDQGIQGIQGIQGEKGDTGAPGSNGTNGKDGANGTSVTVKSVSESTADGGNNVVTFSDGKTVTIKNGSKGSKGDKGDTGATGATGSAGKNGADGYTPVKGTDYFTEADKVEIVQRVIETLGGNPIFGIVDENNNIVVSGDLPDGTYSVKYEMENGTKLNIGNLVIDTNVYYTVTNTLTQCTNSNSATKAVQGGSYSATITAKSGYELKSIVVKMGGTDISSTAVSGGKITISNVTGNIVITAVAEEIKAAYNNILDGDYAIELNKRWSNSSKGYTACNGMIAFTIPKADVWGKTIHFKGFPVGQTSNSNKPLWMTIDTSNSRVNNLGGTSDGTGNIWDSSHLTQNGDVYSLPVNATTFAEVSGKTIKALAINMAFGATAITAIPADAIMTIDEEIV